MREREIKGKRMWIWSTREREIRGKRM